MKIRIYLLALLLWAPAAFAGLTINSFTSANETDVESNAVSVIRAKMGFNSGLVTNNGVVIYSTNGVPQLALPDGSIAIGTGQVYSRTNGAWVPMIGASGGTDSNTVFQIVASNTLDLGQLATQAQSNLMVVLPSSNAIPVGLGDMFVGSDTNLHVKGLGMVLGLWTNNGVVFYSTNGAPQLALPNGSIAVGTGQIYTRTNGAWVAVGGSSSGGNATNIALLSSNIYVRDTNALILDGAKAQTFNVGFLTNGTLLLSNFNMISNLACHDIQLNLHNWTNGGPGLLTLKNVMGNLTTNGSWTQTTNGNATDILVARLDGTYTNVILTAQTNCSSYIDTNSLLTGGGGTWTHVTSISTNANLTAHATVTTPAINTTAGNLIIYSLAIYQGTPLVYDSLGNTLTQLGVYGDSGNAFSNTLAYAISPTTGSSHTFTITNTTTTTEYAVLNVDVWTRSGGAPTFDTANGFNRTTGNTTTYQSGSITTGHNNELIASSFTWNSATVTASSVDSSLSIREQQARGSDPISGGIATGTQTTAGAINPTWIWSGTLNQVGGSTAGWY